MALCYVKNRCHSWPNWFAGRCISEARRCVLAPGQIQLAVGAQSHCADLALMLKRRPNRLAGKRVPQPRGLVAM